MGCRFRDGRRRPQRHRRRLGTSAFVGLATGTNFPDALGGGPVCGSSGEILEIRVVGGTSVVSEDAKDGAGALIY